MLKSFSYYDDKSPTDMQHLRLNLVAADLHGLPPTTIVNAQIDANVGGGYPSDILAQPSLQWLMVKAASLGLQFRTPFVADGQSPGAPVAEPTLDPISRIGERAT